MTVASCFAGAVLLAIGLTQLIEFDYDIPVHFVMSIYYLIFGVL
jgi:hypothetical protein